MPKILIVEDNLEISDSLAGRLQCRGFDVVAAADGENGIAMALTEKPDLVVMDMNMPEIDGWEATRQIKASTAGERVPILALIDDVVAADQNRAFKAGCVGWHTKPIEFLDLLGQIEGILQITPVPEPALLAEGGAVPACECG